MNEVMERDTFALAGQSRPPAASCMRGGASPARIWAQGPRLGIMNTWGLERQGQEVGRSQMMKGRVSQGSKFQFYSEWNGETLEVMLFLLLLYFVLS